jgi:hypothetical protein
VVFADGSGYAGGALRLANKIWLVIALLIQYFLVAKNFWISWDVMAVNYGKHHL